MKLKPFNTTIFTLLFGVIVGILFQNTIKITFEQSVFLLCFFFVTMLISFFFLKKGSFLALFFISFAVGIFSFQIHFGPIYKNHYSNILKPNEFYFLEGKILSVKNNRAIVNLYFSDKQEVKGKVALTFTDTLSLKEEGKRILFRTKFKEITSYKNPYAFDYKAYMIYKQVFWQGYVSSENYKITQNPLPSFFEKIEQLQGKLALSLNKYPFSQESKGVIKALLLGVRSEMDTQIYQNYINAGAVHILAISGLHIGGISQIINVLLLFIFGRKQSRKKWIFIISTLLLSSYAIITGLSASVVRAVVMFGFLGFAQLFKRRQGIFDNLLASMFILLIFNPFYLFDVGFQLSYLAVFSIVTFFPIFKLFFHFENKIVSYVVDLLGVSISAQIGVLPLTLYYFGQFPLLFFVTNLVILPWLIGVLWGGLGVLLLAYFEILPLKIALFYSKLIEVMNLIISKIAGFENFILKEIYFPFSMLLFLFSIVILFAFWLHFRRKEFVFTILISVILWQLFSIFQKRELQTSAEIFVFDGYKNTIIGIRKGEKLQLFCQDLEKIPSYYTSLPFKMNVKNVEIQSLPDKISFFGTIFWIGKTNFPEKITSENYLILTHKVFVSEERLKNIKIKGVITQSNFLGNSFKKENIPFHSTNEKGYFSMKKIFN